MEQLEWTSIVTPAQSLAAVQRAIQAEVLRQSKLGVPVATWRDDQVVWISPEEILARNALRQSKLKNCEP